MDRFNRFYWGAASSATQIEGAWNEGGKCASIWDNAGKHIKNGENCYEACDHFHRYREDVAIMKELGFNSYRFSINPCRIMTAENAINEKGLDFYRDLVKELRANDIEPLCTLYHWDLPQWVQDKGGWKNDWIQEWYLEYVRTVVSALKDDVKVWMTFNEPQMFIMMGYVTGSSAPFKHEVFSFRKHHLRNMLMAHGRAVRLIRELTEGDCSIGIAMASSTFIPHSESEQDIQFARKQSFESIVGEGSNSLYMDPIALGRATPMLRRALSREDLKIISEPIDFIGVNVYQPSNPIIDKKAYEAENRPKSSLGWVVDERCLYWTIRHYWERYQLPVMVTENGISLDDTAEGDECHDPERTDFLRKFISSMMRAVDEKIPVVGYQYWSIMDNFEWCEGYGPRFGLVHIDYETQKRTVKDSARYYASMIASDGRTQ